MTVPVYFYDSSGAAVELSIGGQMQSTLTLNLPALGKAVFETDYQPTAAQGVGMARLDIPCTDLNNCGNVGGFAVFKSQHSG